MSPAPVCLPLAAPAHDLWLVMAGALSAMVAALVGAWITQRASTGKSVIPSLPRFGGGARIVKTQKEETPQAKPLPRVKV